MLKHQDRLLRISHLSLYPLFHAIWFAGFGNINDGWQNDDGMGVVWFQVTLMVAAHRAAARASRTWWVRGL